eukprot:CAMPEP_0114602402 /NCGR_PEP_ID=MMETSP0125-20121206/24978_1 /TAXON_ID=485358 ORGANISM="Aristerostoma sp., Strain ATCC 50986" /NCGR_SAMPLE_ID=MMETSP0125 /ASSEMBLY_ACC=CAM_ASM_000245 /LENGTH=128 /DNA_ID=CAMNT_0001812509 /DNA_START=339 /DNA_END=725 /DNA_ORIENTATION=+
MYKYDPDKWLFETFVNTQNRDYIISELEKKLGTKDWHKKENYRKELGQVMKEYWPKLFESGFDCIERIKKGKEITKEILKTVKEGEEVAIVAHYGIITRFLAKEFNKEGEAVGVPFIDNCQIEKTVVE